MLLKRRRVLELGKELSWDIRLGLKVTGYGFQKTKVYYKPKCCVQRRGDLQGHDNSETRRKRIWVRWHRQADQEINVERLFQSQSDSWT